MRMMFNYILTVVILPCSIFLIGLDGAVGFERHLSESDSENSVSDQCLGQVSFLAVGDWGKLPESSSKGGQKSDSLLHKGTIERVTDAFESAIKWLKQLFTNSKSDLLEYTSNIEDQAIRRW